MSWIDKLIGGKRAAGAAPGATRFLDSEGDEDKPTREASRREMVHVVLRDTMGKHGIPSDWIEGRVLPMASSAGVAGVHVQLVVRKGEERLLAYVHPFLDSFRLELERIFAGGCAEGDGQSGESAARARREGFRQGHHSAGS